MHGLVNRSIQNYVCHRYGDDVWKQCTLQAGLDFTEFEAMLTYEDALTPAILHVLSTMLNRSLPEVMEDIGIYLVSNENSEPVRRLLRFGGVDFVDFLHSLDDLPARARLALSELRLPALELHDKGEGRFDLMCDCPLASLGHLVMGVLRVMADDYGALVFLEHFEVGVDKERIAIELVETSFSQGSRFELGGKVSA